MRKWLITYRPKTHSTPPIEIAGEKHSCLTLHNKVSVSGVFLVHIFPHSELIRRNTEYLSVFNPHAGKYGPEKLRVRTLFTQCKRVIPAMEGSQFKPLFSLRYYSHRFQFLWWQFPLTIFWEVSTSFPYLSNDKLSDVFRTLRNVCDGAFLRK